MELGNVKKMAIKQDTLSSIIFVLSLVSFASQGMVAFYFDLPIPLGVVFTWLYPVLSCRYVKPRIFYPTGILLAAIVYFLFLSTLSSILTLRAMQLCTLGILSLNTISEFKTKGYQFIFVYTKLITSIILLGFFTTLILKLSGVNIPWNIYELSENNVEDFFLPTGFESTTIAYTYSILPWLALLLGRKSNFERVLFYLGLMSFVIIGSRGALLALSIIWMYNRGVFFSFRLMVVGLLLFQIVSVYFPDIYIVEKASMTIADDSRVSGIVNIFVPPLLSHPLGYYSNPEYFEKILVLNGGLAPHNILLTPWLESGVFTMLLTFLLVVVILFRVLIRRDVLAYSLLAVSIYALFHNAFVFTGEMRLGVFYAFLYGNINFYRT